MYLTAGCKELHDVNPSLCFVVFLFLACFLLVITNPFIIFILSVKFTLHSPRVSVS